MYLNRPPVYNLRVWVEDRYLFLESCPGPWTCHQKISSDIGTSFSISTIHKDVDFIILGIALSDVTLLTKINYSKSDYFKKLNFEHLLKYSSDGHI